MSDLLNKELEKQKFQFDTQQINAEESLQKETLKSGDAAQPMKLSKEGKWEVLQGTDTFSFMKYEQGAFDHLVKTREEEKKLDKTEKKELRKKQEALIDKTLYEENESFSLIDELDKNPFKIYEWLKASAAVFGASDSFNELIDAFGKMLNTQGEALQTACIALTVATDNYLSTHSRNPWHYYGKQRILICDAIKERANDWAVLIPWQRQQKTSDANSEEKTETNSEEKTETNSEEKTTTNREKKLINSINKLTEKNKAAYKSALTAINRENQKFIPKYRTNTRDIMGEDPKWNEKWLATFFDLVDLKEQAEANADNPNALNAIILKAEEVKKERKPLLDGLINELMSVTEAEVDKFINDPEYYIKNLERFQHLTNISFLCKTKENPADVDYFDDMDPYFKEKILERYDLFRELNNFINQAVKLSVDSKYVRDDINGFKVGLDILISKKELVFGSAEKRDQIAREKVIDLMKKDNPSFRLSKLWDRESNVLADSFLTYSKKVDKYDNIVKSQIGVNREYNYILYWNKEEDTNKEVLSPKNIAVRKWNERLAYNFKTLIDVGIPIEKFSKTARKTFENMLKQNSKTMIQKHDNPNDGIITDEEKDRRDKYNEIKKIQKEFEEEINKIKKSGIKIDSIDGYAHMSNYYKNTIERIIKEGLIDVPESDIEMYNTNHKIYNMIQNGIKEEAAPAEKEQKSGANADLIEKTKAAVIAKEELYNQMFDTLQEMMDFDITEEKIRDINWISNNFTKLLGYGKTVGTLDNIAKGQAHFLMFNSSEFLKRYRNQPNFKEVEAKFMVLSHISMGLSSLMNYKGINNDEKTLNKKELYMIDYGNLDENSYAEELEYNRSSLNQAIEVAVETYKKYLEVKKRNNG